MTTPLQTLIKQLENRSYGDNAIPSVLYYLKQLEKTLQLAKNITELKNVQGQEGTWDNDDYMRGLYNGLELSSSILQQREPKYKKVLETKDKTIATLKRCLFQMQEAAKYLLKEAEKNHIMDSSEYFIDRDRVFKRNWFKPWVSLTEEEITNAFNIDEQYNEHIYAEIEKVLKRKNGF